MDWVTLVTRVWLLLPAQHPCLHPLAPPALPARAPPPPHLLYTSSLAS
jgi:hypothetical protein